jgi:hypothetical protein
MNSSIFYTILRATQAEKISYRQKLRECERSLHELRTEYFIFEEKYKMNERELAFMTDRN